MIVAALILRFIWNLTKQPQSYLAYLVMRPASIMGTPVDRNANTQFISLSPRPDFCSKEAKPSSK
jgi:hypothetical protein